MALIWFNRTKLLSTFSAEFKVTIQQKLLKKLLAEVICVAREFFLI